MHLIIRLLCEDHVFYYSTSLHAVHGTSNSELCSLVKSDILEPIVEMQIIFMSPLKKQNVGL